MTTCQKFIYRLLLIGIWLAISFPGHTQSDEIVTIAWNPVQDVIAVGTNQTLYLVDSRLVVVEELAVFEKTIIDLRWSPDGNKLAVSLTDNPYSVREIRILNTITGHTVSIVGIIPSAYAAWSSDSKRLAIVRGVRRLVNAVGIYDSDTGTRISSIEPKGINNTVGVYDVAWRPNTEEIAFTVGADLEVWNIQTMQPVGTLPEIKTEDPFIYSPTGEQIAFIYGKKINVFDADTLQLVSTLDHPSGVHSQIWQGSTILSGDVEGIARTWNPDSGQITMSVQTGIIRNGALNSAGTEFAYANEDLSIIVRDALTGEILARLCRDCLSSSTATPHS